MLMEEKQDGRQVKWPHVWERFKVGQSLNLSYTLPEQHIGSIELYCSENN